MPTYKNLSENDLMFPGVGFVKAGETFDFDGLLENPNVIQVNATQAEPAPVAEVAPVQSVDQTPAVQAVEQPVAVAQPVQVQPTTEATN